MSSEATVYVLWGGLKHYSDFKRGDVYYYDLKRNRLYPNRDLSRYDTVYVVDDLLVDGLNMRTAIRNLSLSKEKVVKVGSVITDYAENYLDIVLPEPRINGKIIAYVGYPASGKSMLAKSTSLSLGVPLIKWGDYAKKVGAGLYGERLAKLEEENPFIVCELVTKEHANKTHDLLILDGVKRYDQLRFVTYALRKMCFIVYVKNRLRKTFVEVRGDADDKYDSERLSLFRKDIQNMRKKAIVEIDIFGSWNEYANFMRSVGIPVPSTVWGPNIFLSKQRILDMYEHHVLHKGCKIPLPKKFTKHTSYIERLERKGYSVGGIYKDIITLTATAFRALDDILDENTIRNGKKTMWVRHGVLKTVYYASAMTRRAYDLAKNAGISDKYIMMFRGVIESVRHEIVFEEGSYTPTLQDWIRIAGKEAWFRWFIGSIIDPENSWSMYLDGLRAQAKDDILGETKGGREATEKRLGRVLLQTVVNVPEKELLQRLDFLKGVTACSKEEAERKFVEYLKLQSFPTEIILKI